MTTIALGAASTVISQNEGLQWAGAAIMVVNPLSPINWLAYIICAALVYALNSAVSTKEERSITSSMLLALIPYAIGMACLYKYAINKTTRLGTWLL